MEKSNWPAWRYGPNGQSQVFNSDDEVPAGWQDHPSKVAAEKAPARSPSVKAATAPALDAHGHPWDAKLHAASQSKTSAGLWRMKVGASRPAPAPGFPKPALDL